MDENIGTSRQLIIGLGTGRSGTVSLSKLLNDQPDSYVLHEGFDPINVRHLTRFYGDLLPWNADFNLLEEHLKKLKNKSAPNQFFGDVASYYLPYVEEIIRLYPETKFICMERPKTKMVESFMIKSGMRNHWMNHDGSEWKLDPIWDTIHPKMMATDKHEALGMYWDMYQGESKKLAEKYNNNFMIVETEKLNSVEGKNSILDFIGYPKENRKVEGSYKFNQGKSL